jgi:hypothetical protein
MHQQLWGYKVEWKGVSRGTGGKRLNTTGLDGGYILEQVMNIKFNMLYKTWTAGLRRRRRRRDC